MANCKCSPALINLRNEFNSLFLKRDKSSDGCCASATHSQQNPSSDHEPWRDGYAHAYDIDEDLTPITHTLHWFREYMYANPSKFPQVKYIIYEREIWYIHAGARPRGKYAYKGSNPHDKHMHISIFNSHTHYAGSWYVREAFQHLTAHIPGPSEDLVPEIVRLVQLDHDTPNVSVEFRRPVFRIHEGYKGWVVTEGHANYLGYDLRTVETHPSSWSGWGLKIEGEIPPGWSERGAP